MAIVAQVNVVGPHGETIHAGRPIPEEWPAELVEALVATGGAQEADEEEEG